MGFLNTLSAATMPRLFKRTRAAKTEPAAQPRKLGYKTKYLDGQLETGIYCDADFRRAFELAESCPARRAELENWMKLVKAGKPAHRAVATSFFRALPARGEVNALDFCFGGKERRAGESDKAMNVVAGMWKAVLRQSREAILPPHVMYLRDELREMCSGDKLVYQRA